MRELYTIMVFMKSFALFIALLLCGVSSVQASEAMPAATLFELSEGASLFNTPISRHKSGLVPVHDGDAGVRLMEKSLQVRPEHRSSSVSVYDDLPLALNDQVQYFISFFQTRGRLTYSRWLANSTRYLPIMKDILRREGLPDSLVYVAMIESGFKPHARSIANAVGPWQFMSGTGLRYALRIDQWVDERRDPVKATMAAAMYFKDLYAMFHQDWYLAAAGYNAGENKILRAIDRYDSADFWELCRGDYLKQETKDYVPKLLAAAIIAKNPEKYGFNSSVTIPVTEYDTVHVAAETNLSLVARLAGTTVQTIRELNPSLLQMSTPPDTADYILKVPKGTKDELERGLAAISTKGRQEDVPVIEVPVQIKTTKKGARVKVAENAHHKSPQAKVHAEAPPAQPSVPVHVSALPDAVQKQESVVSKLYYTVRRGDTLSTVARRFKVPAAMLEAWNNLKTAVLVPGHRIIVARYERQDVLHQ